MLNIGFRAHDFGTFSSPEELAITVEKIQSPSFIQLALNKSFPSALPWKDWNEEYISSFSSAFERHNVQIGVIGCYINPVNPDEELRQKEMKRFETSLRLSKAFKCRVVGTETGSLTLDNSYSTKTTSNKVLSRFYNSLDYMLEQAIKYDAVCAIEPVAKQHTICSLERSAALLDKFKDDHLKIIYDPINLLPFIGLTEEDGAVLETPSNEAVEKYVSKALDIFGTRLAAIHCKDFRLNEEGYKIWNIPSPHGVFNWSIVFNQLRQRNIDVPILLEDLNPQTVASDLLALKQL